MTLIKQSHGLTLAIMAGMMASLGSTCAKLAMSGDIVLSYCQNMAGNQVCKQVNIVFSI